MLAIYPAWIEVWLQLIRAEFEEPSGLQVTAAQAAERWPLEPVKLTALLDALVYSKYLSRGADGVYFRRPCQVAARASRHLHEVHPQWSERDRN